MRALVVLKRGLPDGYLEEALFLAGALGASEADFYHARKVDLSLLEATSGYGLLVLPEDPGSWELGEVFEGALAVPRGSYPYMEVVAVGEAPGAEELAARLGLRLVRVRRLMPWDVRKRGRLGVTKNLGVAKRLRFSVAVLK